MTWAVKYRPRRFGEVVGQAEEIKILGQIVAHGWRPPAVLFSGDYGCGKTTLARLLARALLCERPAQGPLAPEPCGECESCAAMEAQNHTDYLEVDAASHGGIDAVRQIREQLAYKTRSGLRLVCFDECHGISAAGQNALLNTLEEGHAGVIFLFCTTDPQKMLATVRSRCIEIPVRLLRVPEIEQRVGEVAKAERIGVEPVALRLIATYARGHLRNALMTLEQLAKTAPAVSEAVARAYLRLDRRDAVYRMLVAIEPKAQFLAVEELLCRFPIRELADEIGEILVDAYKVSVGIDEFPEADVGWLKRVVQVVGKRFLMSAADRVFQVSSDLPTIQAGTAAVLAALEKVDASTLAGVSSAHHGLTVLPGGAEDVVPDDLRKG